MHSYHNITDFSSSYCHIKSISTCCKAVPSFIFASHYPDIPKPTRQAGKKKKKKRQRKRKKNMSSRIIIIYHYDKSYLKRGRGFKMTTNIITFIP